MTACLGTKTSSVYIFLGFRPCLCNVEKLTCGVGIHKYCLFLSDLSRMFDLSQTGVGIQFHKFGYSIRFQTWRTLSCFVLLSHMYAFKASVFWVTTQNKMNNELYPYIATIKDRNRPLEPRGSIKNQKM